MPTGAVPRACPEQANRGPRTGWPRSSQKRGAVISFHEQVLGCHTDIGRARTPADLVRGYRLLDRLLGDYAMAPVLPSDDAAAAEFEGLRAKRVRIGTMDPRIASTALSRGLTLVTRNSADFQRVPGLFIEDWTRSFGRWQRKSRWDASAGGSPPGSG